MVLALKILRPSDSAVITSWGKTQYIYNHTDLKSVLTGLLQVQLNVVYNRIQQYSHY